VNNKAAYTITDQIALLKQREMLFKDEARAYGCLKNISYYRLKGYWWDTQSDISLHRFQSGTYFEDIMERYDFDRKLRLILLEGVLCFYSLLTSQSYFFLFSLQSANLRFGVKKRRMPYPRITSGVIQIRCLPASNRKREAQNHPACNINRGIPAFAGMTRFGMNTCTKRYRASFFEVLSGIIDSNRNTVGF
jgi:hypothetical protein